MRRVYKYPIPTNFVGLEAVFELEIPEEAKALTVQVQNSVPCLWAEVWSSDEPKKRKFRIVGTGWDIPAFFDYVGTWQEGPFVWHLYERND